MRQFFKNVGSKVQSYQFLLRSKKHRRDLLSKLIIYGFAALTIAILVVLIGFIIYKSVFFFQNYNFWSFIGGGHWDAAANDFGIWKIIISTFFVLIITLAFAVPLNLFCSLFITEYLSQRWRKRIVGIIQLLAGVPSIVFGLFALSILGPLFMAMGAPSSANLLVTAITLAFMSLPIMISLSVNALEAVPSSLRFGTMALGLSRTFTTFKVVLKSASPKIAGAVMMGIARIIGETMAVMMICGNNPDGANMHNGFMNFIFSAVSTLASTIGLEILENSGPMHESALYAIGFILFILVAIINLIVLGINNLRNRKVRNHHFSINDYKTNLSDYEINNIIWSRGMKMKPRRKVQDAFGMFFMVSSTFIVVVFTLVVIISIIWNGLFSMHWADLISTSTYQGGAGILSAFTVTVLLVICSMMFAIPLSLIVAVYLNEYADKSSWFAKILRFTIDVLASTPSIVFGTFGLAFFIGLCGLQLSVLAAGLTLTLVLLPMMIRNIEDALSFVPDELRQASLALGANKTETTTKVVLPNAMSGLCTSVILAIARVIGESAPVYLTLGTAVRLPIDGFMSPGASMTTQILMLWKEGPAGSAMRIMYELAFVIMFLVLLMNWAANAVAKRLSQDYVKVPFKTRWTKRWYAVKHFDVKVWYHQTSRPVLGLIDKAKKQRVNRQHRKIDKKHEKE